MAILSAGSSKATTGGIMEHKIFLYFWAGGREGEKWAVTERNPSSLKTRKEKYVNAQLTQPARATGQ